jgi:hypothetical protein
MNFADMLTGPVQDPNAPPPQAQPQGLPYSQTINPVAPALQEMNRPAADPQDFAQRVQGWGQVVSQLFTNPNFARAIGIFGQHAMQPRAPGQTTIGQLGNAIGMGRTAYEFGQEAELAQQYRQAEEERKARREGREERESDVNVRSTEEAIRTRKTQNQISEATMQDTIRKASLEVTLAEANIQKARTVEEKERLALSEAQRVKRIFDQISDAALREEAIAKIKEPTLRNLLLQQQVITSRAQAGAAGASATANLATARYQTARARQEEQEADLGPAGRASLLSKAGQQSAQVQQMNWFEEKYKAANPGASAQQVAQAALTYAQSAKAKSDRELYFKWAENNYDSAKTPEENYAAFDRQLQMFSSPGSPTGPARMTPLGPVGGEVEWVRDPKTGKLIKKAQ